MLPFSSLVILADWLPPAVALLAGLAWRRMPGRTWRKTVLVLPLVGLCGYRSAARVVGEPPPLDERWKAGVCRQTSQASCSAAAAATLLRAHGIDATEAEMARLCLTRGAGTPMHGLYRGLLLKTRDTPWRVEVFHETIGTLRSEPGPVILSVRLNRGANVDPRYERLWGWAPGVKHTVCFFGFRDDGTTDVGDPAVGGSDGESRTCASCGTATASGSRSGKIRRVLDSSGSLVAAHPRPARHRHRHKRR